MRATRQFRLAILACASLVAFAACSSDDGSLSKSLVPTDPSNPPVHVNPPGCRPDDVQHITIGHPVCPRG